MNRYLILLSLLSSLLLSSCLKFSGEEAASDSAGGVAAEAEAVVLNFNPNRTISLEGLLDKYPDASNFYIGVKGITGVSISADEARDVGSVTIGARGAAPYYEVVITTPGGNIRTKLY